MKLKTLMLICAVFLLSCITLQANEGRLSTLRKTHLKQLKILKHIHEQQQNILLRAMIKLKEVNISSRSIVLIVFIR